MGKSFAPVSDKEFEGFEKVGGKPSSNKNTSSRKFVAADDGDFSGFVPLNQPNEEAARARQGNPAPPPTDPNQQPGEGQQPGQVAADPTVGERWAELQRKQEGGTISPAEKTELDKYEKQYGSDPTPAPAPLPDTGVTLPNGMAYPNGNVQTAAGNVGKSIVDNQQFLDSANSIYDGLKKKFGGSVGDIAGYSNTFTSPLTSKSQSSIASEAVNNVIIPAIKKEKNFKTDEDAIAYINSQKNIEPASQKYKADLAALGVNDPKNFLDQPLDTLTDWYKKENANISTLMGITQAKVAAATTNSFGQSFNQNGLKDTIANQRLLKQLQDKKDTLNRIKDDYVSLKLSPIENPMEAGLQYSKNFVPEQFNNIARKLGLDPETTTAKQVAEIPFDTLANKLPQSLLASIEENGAKIKIRGTANDTIEKGLRDRVAQKAIMLERSISDIDFAMQKADPQTRLQLDAGRKHMLEMYANDSDVAALAKADSDVVAQTYNLQDIAKKYPEVYAKRQMMQKIKEANDGRSWWQGILYDDVTDIPSGGKYTSGVGFAPAVAHALVSTGAETVKTINSALASLGMKDKGNAYMDNIGIDQAIENRFMNPINAMDETSREIPEVFKRIAKETGVKDEAFTDFGDHPTYKFNWKSVPNLVGETTGQVVGQALLSEFTGGLLGKAAGLGMKGAALGMEAASGTEFAAAAGLDVAAAKTSIGLSRIGKVLRGAEAREKIGLFASTYATTYGSNYEQAIDAGLSDKDATAYSLLSSTGTAFTELLETPTQQLKRAIGLQSGKKANILSTVEILNNPNLPKAQRIFNAMKHFTGHTLKEAGAETAEEVLDAWKTSLMDNAFGVDTTGMDFIENTKQTAVSTFIGMLPMAMMGGITGKRKHRQEALWAAGSEPEKYREFLQDRVDNAKPDRQQSEQDKMNHVMKVANTMSGIIAALPEKNAKGRTLTEDEKMEMAEAIFKHKKNQADQAAADPDIPQPQTSQENPQSDAVAIAHGTAPFYAIDGNAVSRDAMHDYIHSDQYAKDRDKVELTIENDDEVNNALDTRNTVLDIHKELPSSGPVIGNVTEADTPGLIPPPDDAGPGATFESAGNESKSKNDPAVLGNWMLDNSKHGDTITDADGNGYEVTSVSTRKDGTRELMVTPFEVDETGKKDYNHSGVKLISDNHKGAASNLFETSYTNAKGERVTEQYKYNSANTEGGAVETAPTATVGGNPVEITGAPEQITQPIELSTEDTSKADTERHQQLGQKVTQLKSVLQQMQAMGLDQAIPAVQSALDIHTRELRELNKKLGLDENHIPGTTTTQAAAVDAAAAEEPATGTKPLINVARFQGKPLRTDLSPEEQAESDKVGQEIKDRFNKAPKVVADRQVNVTLPNGEKMSGRFVLVPHNSITPSHNPNSFSDSKGFPMLEDGKNPNDRDYTLAENKASVVSRANKYDGRALQDLPTVTPDGVVIDGNDRTMSGHIAARNKTDGEYDAELRNRLQLYGFTDDDYNFVAQAGNPRLVFVTDNVPAYNTDTFAKFNRSKTKAKSAVSKAIELSRTVPERIVRQISSIIEPFEKLSDFYQNRTAAKAVKDVLMAAGLITQDELAGYYDHNTDKFSAPGEEFLEGLLIGRVVGEEELHLLNKEGMREYRTMIVKTITTLTNINAMGEDVSLKDAISNAIRLKDTLIQNPGFMPKKPSPAGKWVDALNNYLSQQVLFGEIPDSDTVIAFLHLEGTLKNWVSFLNAYSTSAGSTAMGNSMFAAAEDNSRAAIILRTAEHFDNDRKATIKKAGTPSEKQPATGSGTGKSNSSNDAAQPGAVQGAEGTKNSGGSAAPDGQQQNSGENNQGERVTPLNGDEVLGSYKGRDIKRQDIDAWAKKKQDADPNWKMTAHGLRLAFRLDNPTSIAVVDNYNKKSKPATPASSVLQKLADAFKKRFGIETEVIGSERAREMLSDSEKHYFFQILDEIDLFDNLDPRVAKDFIYKVFTTVNTPEDAKKAFRKLAVKFHPDKAGAAATEIMSYLNDTNDNFKAGTMYKVKNPSASTGSSQRPGSSSSSSSSQRPGSGSSSSSSGSQNSQQQQQQQQQQRQQQQQWWDDFHRRAQEQKRQQEEDLKRKKAQEDARKRAAETERQRKAREFDEARIRAAEDEMRTRENIRNRAEQRRREENDRKQNEAKSNQTADDAFDNGQRMRQSVWDTWKSSFTTGTASTDRVKPDHKTGAEFTRAGQEMWNAAARLAQQQMSENMRRKDDGNKAAIQEFEKVKKVLFEVYNKSNKSQAAMDTYTAGLDANNDNYRKELEKIQHNWRDQIDVIRAREQKSYAEAAELKKRGTYFSAGMKFQLSDDNIPAGFYDPATGKAYVVDGKADDTTSIHESFSHPLIQAAEKRNPELYGNLLREAKADQQVVDAVNAKYDKEGSLDHEYIAAAIDLAARKQLQNKTLIDYVNEFWNDVKAAVKDIFGGKPAAVENIDAATTIAELTDFVLRSGVEMNLDPTAEVAPQAEPVESAAPAAPIPEGVEPAPARPFGGVTLEPSEEAFKSFIQGKSKANMFKPFDSIELDEMFAAYQKLTVLHNSGEDVTQMMKDLRRAVLETTSARLQKKDAQQQEAALRAIVEGIDNRYNSFNTLNPNQNAFQIQSTTEGVLRNEGVRGESQLPGVEQNNGSKEPAQKSKRKEIPSEEIKQRFPKLYLKFKKYLVARDAAGKDIPRDVPAETLFRIVTHIYHGGIWEESKKVSVIPKSLDQLDALIAMARDGESLLEELEVANYPDQKQEALNAIRRSNFTQKEKDFMTTVVESMPKVSVGLKLLFSIVSPKDGTAGQYDWSKRLLSADNAVTFVHELGHMAFYEVLSGTDRVAYLEGLRDAYVAAKTDKLFPEFLKDHIVIREGEGGISLSNSFQNLGEIFAQQSTQHVFSLTSEAGTEAAIAGRAEKIYGDNPNASRSGLQKAYDFLVATYRKLRDRNLVIPEIREVLDKSFNSDILQGKQKQEPSPAAAQASTLKAGDAVRVKGSNGAADFAGTFKGESRDGEAYLVTNNATGMQQRVEKESVTPEAKPTEYHYALRIRPFGIGTYPDRPEDGFVRFEENPQYPKFGVVVYDKPLPQEKADHFSLTPITEAEQYEGKKVLVFEHFGGEVVLNRDKNGAIEAVTVNVVLDNGEIDPTRMGVSSFLSNVKSGKYRVEDAGENAATQYDDAALRPLVGDTALQLIKKNEAAVGKDVISRERVISNAKKIAALDKKEGIPVEAVAEALQLEYGYADNWQDLRNAVKKGGYELNKEGIDRITSLGIELPKEITDSATPGPNAPITFQSEGKSVTGTPVTIPGYEGADFVVTKEGMIYNIHEVASGLKVAQSNAFSEAEAVADIKKQMDAKNFSVAKIFSTLQSNQNTSKYSTGGSRVLPVNAELSPKYQKYLADEQAREDAKPFRYSEEERDALRGAAERADREGATQAAENIRRQIDIKRNTPTDHKFTIDEVHEHILREMRQNRIDAKKAAGEPLNEDEDKKVVAISEEGFNSNIIGDRKKTFPMERFNELYNAYRKGREVLNYYGYVPAHLQELAAGEAYITRLAIEHKTGNVTERTLGNVSDFVAAANRVHAELFGDEQANVEEQANRPDGDPNIPKNDGTKPVDIASSDDERRAAEAALDDMFEKEQVQPVLPEGTLLELQDTHFEKEAFTPSEADLDKLLKAVFTLGLTSYNDILSYLQRKGGKALAYMPVLQGAYRRARTSPDFSDNIKNNLDNDDTIRTVNKRFSIPDGQTSEGMAGESGPGFRGGSESGRTSSGTDGTTRPGIRYSGFVPAPTQQHVSESAYPIDIHQRLAVNLAIDTFDVKNTPGFMLADGPGVGKTRMMLAMADYYHKKGEKVLLVSLSGTISSTLVKDAAAMGIDLKNFEIGTYDDISAGKVGRKEYGIAIFDESHNVKNAGSKKAIMFSDVESKRTVFVSATPMDMPMHASYFLHRVLNISQEELNKRLGLSVEYIRLKDGSMKPMTRFVGGLDTFIERLNDARLEAMENGAMIRREYPFFGTVKAATIPTNGTLNAQIANIQQIHDSRIENIDSIGIGQLAGEMERRGDGAFFANFKVLSNQYKAKSGHMYETVVKKIREALGKERVKYFQNIDKYNEPHKVDYIIQGIRKALANGQSVAVALKAVNPATVTAGTVSTQGKYGYHTEKVTPLLKALREEMKRMGIAHAEILGGNDPKKTKYKKNMDAFQSGQAKVLLFTPDSGGTGIDLDDQIGDQPRKVFIATLDYAGDALDQLLGRFSRRNTKSPVDIEVVRFDNPGDNNRLVKSQQKSRVMDTMTGGIGNAAGMRDQYEEEGFEDMEDSDSEKEVVEVPKDGLDGRRPIEEINSTNNSREFYDESQQQSDDLAYALSDRKEGFVEDYDDSLESGLADLHMPVNPGQNQQQRSSNKPRGNFIQGLDWGRMNKMNRNFADFMARAKQILDKIKSTGITIDETNNFYDLFYLMQSKIAGRITQLDNYLGATTAPHPNSYIRRFQKDFTEWLGGKGKYFNAHNFQPFVVDANGNKTNMKAEDLLQKFGMFQYAKHAQERNDYVAMKQGEVANKEIDRVMKIINALDPVKDAAKIKANRDYITSILAGNEKGFPLMKDGGSGMTNAQAQGILDEAKNAGLQDMFEDYASEFRNNIVLPNLEAKLKYGLISTEDYDTLLNYYQHYVPLRKDLNEEFANTSYNSWSTMLGKDMFRTKGAPNLNWEDRVNPVVQATQNYKNTIVLGEGNIVNRSLGQLILEFPDESWEVLTAKSQDRKKEKALAGRYFFNGEPYYIYIHDKELFKAVTKQDLKTMSAFPIVQKLIRYKSKIVTTYQLRFQINNALSDFFTSQANLTVEDKGRIRDKARQYAIGGPGVLGSMRALLKGDVTGAKDLMKGQKALGAGRAMWGYNRNPGQELKTEWADWANRFVLAGGMISYNNNTTLERTMESITNAFQSDKDEANRMEKALEWWDQLSGSVENGMRLAVFRALVEEGVPEYEAAVQSKASTTDFTKRGNYSAYMSAAYLFFNPSVQGNVSFMNRVKTYPKRAAWTAGISFAAGMAMSAMNEMFSDCEDRKSKDCYDNIQDWEKENYFILPGPNGFFKIKMPRNWSYFYTQGVNLMDYFSGRKNGAEVARGFVNGAYEAMSPVSTPGGLFAEDGSVNWQMVLPTVLMPFIGSYANKDVFGRPIVKEQPKFAPNKPDSQTGSRKAGAVTTAIAEGLNKLTGGNKVESGSIDVSPDSIDYWMDQGFGGFYKTAGDFSSTVQGLYNGNLESKDIPLVSSLYTQSHPYVNMGRIYTLQARGGHEKLSQAEMHEFDKLLRQAARPQEEGQKPYISFQELKRMKTSMMKAQGLIRRERIREERNDEYDNE